MGRVTINVDFAWDAGQDYYITADAGFVVDAVSGTPSPAIASTTEITFTTLNAPSVDYSNINDGGASFMFRSRSQIELDFAQNVTAVAGKNIYVKNGATTVDTIPITDAVYDDVAFKFTTETNVYLDPAITYTCYLEAGGVVDDCGFTSAQFAGTITTDVSSSLNDTFIVIDYCQLITKGTGDIRLYTPGDVLVETIDVTGSQVTVQDETTLKVTPTVLLPKTTDGYYILTDAGVALDATNFEAPAITSKGSPEVSYTIQYSTVTGDIIFNFDRDVFAGVGSIRLYSGVGALLETFNVTTDVTFSGTKATITAELIQGEDYYVLIDNAAIVDIDGIEFNGIASTTAQDFTVESGPTISSLSPADGSTIDSDTDFQINYPVSVTPTGYGTATLYKTVGDSVVDTVTATDFVGNTGTSFTLPFTLPGGGVKTGEGLYVLSDPLIVKDGRGFSGLESVDATDWDLTIGNLSYSFNLGDAGSKVIATSADDIVVLQKSSERIAKFDDFSSKSWERTLAGLDNFTTIDIKTDSDDDIIVLSSQANSGDYFGALLTKLNGTTGATIWSKHIKWSVATANFTPIGFAIGNNDSIFVTGRVTNDGTHFAMVSVDTDGTVDWSKSIAATDYVLGCTVNSTDFVVATRDSVSDKINLYAISQAAGTLSWSSEIDTNTTLTTDPELTRLASNSSDDIIVALSAATTRYLFRLSNTGTLDWQAEANAGLGNWDDLYIDSSGNAHILYDANLAGAAILTHSLTGTNPIGYQSLSGVVSFCINSDDVYTAITTTTYDTVLQSTSTAGTWTTTTFTVGSPGNSLSSFTPTVVTRTPTNTSTDILELT